MIELTVPTYSTVVQRILDILKHDTEFSKQIGEFRFGDYPDMTNFTNFPLCYVTTARSPEVIRTTMFPNPNPDELPHERRVYEYWIVLVTTSAVPESTQKSLYDLTHDAQVIFESNLRLKDPVTGDDPLCASMRILTQGRLDTQRGKLLESITIRLRPVLYT